MLVNTVFLESINKNSFSIVTCLSIDLDRKISRISLDSTAFFLFFFFIGLKLITSKFSKTCHSQEITVPEIRFFQLTELNTREN